MRERWSSPQAIYIINSFLKCLKKKENLVNAFKREIDNNKDNFEDIKSEYIKVKNSFGKKVTKKIKGNNRRDLIEGI